MKKILLSMMAATMIFATSCENELELGAAGEESVVSFTIATPDMGSRAYSDGTTATVLQYAVYDAAGNILDDLGGSKTMVNRGAKIDLKLTTGNTYSVIFWAAAEGAPYTVNFTNKTMTVDYTTAVSNDESRDAFYKYHTFAVNGAQTETIELKRPFAQLNIGTKDYAASASAGYTPTQSAVTVKNIYKTLDLVEGHVSDPVVAEFKAADIKKDETFPVESSDPNAPYEYLAMNYLLVGADKETVDVEFTYTDGSNAKTRTVGSVPVQRNYRTNIYGELLTSEVDINVTIEPNYNEEDYMIYNVVVDGVSYNDFATAADKAMELGKAVEFVQNVTIDADETITVPAGKTLNLNLNGYTLVGVSDQIGSNREMFLVKGTMTVNGANTMSRAAAAGNGIIAIKHKGDNMEWSAMTTVFDVTAGGVLNIKNANAINYGGSDMGFVAHLNNWGEVTLNVENSTLESNYVAVRVFNSGNDMNNVTINNSTLKGGSNAFWVHNYTAEDFGGDTNKVNTQKGLLNFNIFNGTNTFVGKNDTPIRYGMTNAVYVDENGLEKITTASGEVVEGIGTNLDGDYVVTSAEGFEWITEAVENGTLDNETIVLNNDIDLSAMSRAAVSNWTPIGTAENPFTGTFDGKGKTIKNLVINGGSNSNIGFFGFTTDGEIKNVTFENAKVSGRLNVGVVAGTPYTSKYTNITVKGHVEVNGMAYVGAVGGKNAYADWTNITVDVDNTSYVNANSVENGTAYRTYVGGVCGFNGEGGHSFKNITSNINVKGSTCDVGGLFGIAHYGNKFENCVCTGNVEIYAAEEEAEAQEIGGIAGVWHNQDGQTVTMTNCKFTGTLKANKDFAINTNKFGNLVCAAYNTTGKGKLIIDGKEYECNGNYTINGCTPVTTADELVAALEANEGVYLLNDIKIEPANMSNAYGKTGINVKNGQTIDGGGHTLNIQGAGGTWDSGINTTGGIIRNITVTGSFRGIFINHNSEHSEKVVLENVTLTGVTYTISCDQGKYQGIEATNCTFNGWTSFAKTAGEAKFVNCTFGEGNGYKYCRPYSNTEFVNCTFCPGFAVDTTRATVTFTDCTWEE